MVWFTTGKLKHALEHLTRHVGRVADLMAEDLEWRRTHAGFATKLDLQEIEKRLIMNQQELSVLLDNQKTQVGKIAKEQSDRFDVVTKKVDELTKLIEAGGAITPALETKATELQTAIDNLDAAIPDAVPPVS